MTKQYRSYWGVLPGEIVHAENLTIAAKYLYVLLSSMAHEKGFCWPENETLANDMQLSKRRVVELLGMLRDSGFIRIIFKQEGKKERRYIYCGMFPDRVESVPEDDVQEEKEATVSPCEISQGEGAKDNTPPCEDSHPPMREIRFANKDEKKKEKQKENTPKAPQGRRREKTELAEDVKALLRDYVGEDRELAQEMAALVEVRAEKKAVNSKRAVRMLLAELDRLSGGRREDKLLLIRQSVVNSWKSVFPLRGGNRDQPPPSSVVASEEVPTW